MASKRTQSIKTHDWLQANVVSLLCERKRPGKRAAWHDREAESDGCARWRLVRRRMRQRENHTSYHKSLKHKQRQYERIRKERNREDGAPVYRQRAHSTPRHSRRAELRWLLKHTRQRNGREEGLKAERSQMAAQEPDAATEWPRRNRRRLNPPEGESAPRRRPHKEKNHLTP